MRDKGSSGRAVRAGEIHCPQAASAQIIEPNKTRYRNTAKPLSFYSPPSANPGRNTFQTQISGIVGFCCQCCMVSIDRYWIWTSATSAQGRTHNGHLRISTTVQAVSDHGEPAHELMSNSQQRGPPALRRLVQGQPKQTYC